MPGRIVLKKSKAFGVVSCVDCKAVVVKTGPKQSYCPTCSEKRDLERKRLWMRSHPAPKDRARETARRLKSTAIQRGLQISKNFATGTHWITYHPDAKWSLRVAVPFSYAASKNAIYRSVGRGHVVLRKEHRETRDGLTAAIQKEFDRVRPRVVNNKVWLDVLVQKPDHKGDAVNVIDFVCDAVKVVIGVDDRWFSIRRLDWEVVKHEPKLVVGVCQLVDWDAVVCSHCGRVLPHDAFNKNKTGMHGVGRACRDCRNTKSPIPMK